MKKTILFLFFVSVLSISQVSSAYIGLGSQYNPIHVQIEHSPSDRLREEMRDYQNLTNSLKAQYGIDAYYDCYNSISCTKIDYDLSFPGAHKMCGYSIQSCLIRKPKPSLTIQPQIAPTVIPKTNDQVCNDTFLNSVWNGKYDSSTGKILCDCKNGNQWNSSNTQCVASSNKVIQQNINSNTNQTNDQRCVEAYGNSNWGGKLNDKGGPVCDCKPSYTWNDTKTQCVSMKCNPDRQWNSKRTECVLIKSPVKKVTTVPQISEQNQTASVVSIQESIPSEPTSKKVGLFRHILNWFR